MHVRITPRSAGLAEDLGAPRLPGSKSHAQRALLLAGYLPQRTIVENVPDSDDVRVMLAAIAGRGAAVARDGDTVTVEGVARRPGESLRIDAGANATVARMWLMLAPLLGAEIRVDGDAGLRRRPMHAIRAALRALAVPVDGEQLPLRVDGRRLGGVDHVALDGAVTTQPASGAMLALALGHGGVVEIAAPRDAAAARGYPQLTAQLLRQFGATVSGDDRDGVQRYRIGAIGAGGADAGGERRYRVPADPSARAFVGALAAMHGRTLPPQFADRDGDRHPDWGIDADIAASRAAGESDLALTDLGRRPDCVPAMAALAATRAGTTTMTGLAILRAKESDRLAAIATALAAVGVTARVVGDDLTIRGPLPPGTAPLAVPVVADHRIVMAMALLGTCRAGGVELAHAEATGKSWPGFFDWLARCATVDRG